MGPLSLFVTGPGVLFLGALAALIVLLWDWRVALGALALIQVGVAVLVVGAEGVPAQMMVVQTLVIGLCCTMLAMSGMQMQMTRTGRQSGNWFFRLLVLGLLAVALLSLDLQFTLPKVSPAIARLFGWMGLLALVMFSLGDHPLFTSVALLLWSVLGYALAAVYVPVPEVLALIGLVELTIGLACSYLIVAERLRLQPPPARNAPLLFEQSLPAAGEPAARAPVLPARPGLTRHEPAETEPPAEPATEPYRLGGSR